MKEETRKKREAEREAKRKEREEAFDELLNLQTNIRRLRGIGPEYFSLSCRFASDQHDRAMREVTHSLEKDHPLFGFAVLFCPAVKEKLRFCIPASTEIDDYLAELERRADQLVKDGPENIALLASLKLLQQAFYAPDCDEVKEIAASYRARAVLRNNPIHHNTIHL